VDVKWVQFPVLLVAVDVAVDVDEQGNPRHRVRGSRSQRTWKNQRSGSPALVRIVQILSKMGR